MEMHKKAFSFWGEWASPPDFCYRLALCT